MADYYDLLGVGRDVDGDTLKRAYRPLLRRLLAWDSLGRLLACDPLIQCYPCLGGVRRAPVLRPRCPPATHVMH